MGFNRLSNSLRKSLLKPWNERHLWILWYVQYVCGLLQGPRQSGQHQSSSSKTWETTSSQCGGMTALRLPGRHRSQHCRCLEWPANLQSLLLLTSFCSVALAVAARLQRCRHSAAKRILFRPRKFWRCLKATDITAPPCIKCSAHHSPRSRNGSQPDFVIPACAQVRATGKSRQQ